MRSALKQLILLSILVVALARAPQAGAAGRSPCWFQAYFHTLQGPHARVASQILDHWDDFQAEARRAALGTFGFEQVPLARASLRERIITWRVTAEESHAYALFFRSAVQLEIDQMHLGPRNGARSGLYDRMRLEGFASHGVVLVAHALPSQQERAAKLLNTHRALRILPRVAVADEEVPLKAALSREISKVLYWPHPFEGRLLETIEPRYPVFDIHLVGGILHTSLAQGLGAFAEHIAQDNEVGRVRVFVHVPVSYLPETTTPFDTGDVPLEVALTRDSEALAPWTRSLARAFGAPREVLSDVPTPFPNAYVFVRPDNKIVSVHIEPRI